MPTTCRCPGAALPLPRRYRTLRLRWRRPRSGRRRQKSELLPRVAKQLLATRPAKLPPMSLRCGCHSNCMRPRYAWSRVEGPSPRGIAAPHAIAATTPMACNNPTRCGNLWRSQPHGVRRPHGLRPSGDAATPRVALHGLGRSHGVRRHMGLRRSDRLLASPKEIVGVHGFAVSHCRLPCAWGRQHYGKSPHPIPTPSRSPKGSAQETCNDGRGPDGLAPGGWRPSLPSARTASAEMSANGAKCWATGTRPHAAKGPRNQQQGADQQSLPTPPTFRKRRGRARARASRIDPKSIQGGSKVHPGSFRGRPGVDPRSTPGRAPCDCVAREAPS